MTVSRLRTLLASAAFGGLAAAPAAADTQLHILHLNDFHSRIESINRFGSTCSAADEAEGKCFGGAARILTLVNQLRDQITAEGHPVIVLDAGDASQGSLFYTTYGGQVEADFIERVGFDVMAVGNHEFDLGPAGLAVFLDTLTMPVVSGNIDVSQENQLAGRVAPYTILERGDLRIGIISALAMDTPEIAAPGPNVIFRDDIESLQHAVSELQEQGVGTIIALTHVGYSRDLDIAAAVDGIDAVVGGHSHTYLSASDPAREGPYPTWTNAPDGSFVPVVQAGSNGRWLGHLVLDLDDEGNVLDARGDTISIDATVEPDAATLEWIAGLAGPIDELRNTVVAASSGHIEGDRTVCRQVECSMGNLVTDAMLARVAGQGITLAFQSGGGLRASIDEGEVTMGEVLAVLPFQNTLATFQITGANVIAALENGASQVEEGAGRFLQVGGLRYAFDPALPAGARVSEVLVADGETWVPIDPEATYGAVSYDYLRGGGDGFRVFRDHAINPYDFGPDLADVLAEYLAANQPYTPYTDGRITRIGAN